jgi:hypothetical protein
VISAGIRDLDEGPIEPTGPDATFEREGPIGLRQEPVEVRRNGALAAAIGGIASGVAIGYLARAASTGSALDWVVGVALGVLGVAHLISFVDARVPLLVADTQGIRLRLGRTWQGLPWGAIREVQHRPRRGWLRDGRLAVVVGTPGRLIEELDRRGRGQAALARRLYGSPFALPLALTTRVRGAEGDLTAALEALADGAAPVVELAPAEPVQEEPLDLEHEAHEEPVLEADAEELEDGSHDWASDEAPDRRARLPFVIAKLRDPRPWIAHQLSELSASRTPSPLRDPAPAARAEITVDVEPVEEEAPEGRALRRPGSVELFEDTVSWGDRGLEAFEAEVPAEGPERPVQPIVLGEFDAEPAEDPVIGPEFAAARQRLALSIDQLSDRTRIRPHVLESIEVDDFVPCGGDFYARGHIRTLGRVLGVDVAPLLAEYDTRYADAPVSPRRVFEAELASSSIRGTRGGPDWSILVAAVMALVLAWSVARLVMDSGAEVPKQPSLNGSAGVRLTSGQLANAVPVSLTAAGGGARVILRDGTGKVIFHGPLSFGQTRSFRVSPPVRVQTTDGSLTVTVNGQDKGALGATGRPASNTFVVD